MTTSAGHAHHPVTAIDTADYHTAGEPFRIVTGGLPPVPGTTVAERRTIAQGPDGRRLEEVRRLLSREPRGHPGMYGGFIVPPDDDQAHLGVLFWHKSGYSTACGHGTMALGAWAVDSGLVTAPDDGTTPVRIDVPSGRVTAAVHRTGGRTSGVTFRNVPAQVTARHIPVPTPYGTLRAGITHAGACYVSVPAEQIGLPVTTQRLPDLVAAAREIRTALADEPAVRHPADARLSGIYGVILHEDLPDTPSGPSQRNVTVFGDGQIDRSPCGSGTSARLALLTAEGRLGPDGELRHESVIGTVFTGRVTGTHPDGLLTEVTGQAHRTGEHRFLLDPHDTLGTGFLL